VHDVEESTDGDAGDWVLPGEVISYIRQRVPAAVHQLSRPVYTTTVGSQSVISNLLYRFDLTHSNSRANVILIMRWYLIDHRATFPRIMQELTIKVTGIF
jgi:hypothetical protein